MQGICKACGRLIFDTEKLDELPDKLECQHCGFVNIIRSKPEPAKVIEEGVTAPSKPLVIRSKQPPKPTRRRKK